MGNAMLKLSLPLKRNASDTVAPSSPCHSDEDGDFPDDLPELEEVSAPSPSPECSEVLQGTCAVCFEEGSVLQLDCEHTYCQGCLEGQLAARWPGPRETFQYLQCALCRAPLQHNLIKDAVEKHLEFRERVVAVAVRKFCEDTSPDYREENVEARAEAEMTVYMCDECTEPYCAGRVDCANAAAEADVAETHRCHECEWARLAKRNDRRCMIHGHRFAMFKCDSCCAVATWNCYSNLYCERCHNQAGDSKHYPCPGPELCPLGIPHPRNCRAVHGADEMVSFVLGCTACLGCEDATDADFGEQNHFGYPERDWSAFSSGAELLESIGEQEVRHRLGEQSNVVGSALASADQLLALEKQKIAARAARLEAALAWEAAEEARKAFVSCKTVAELQEAAAAAELAAREAAAVPSANDPVALKAQREATMGESARRESTRRTNIAAKLLRLSLGKRSRQRGGRHKVPAVIKTDDWIL